MKRFRAIILAAVSLAAASSTSLASETPLPPGKPAGTHQAAHGGHLLMTLGVAALLVGGVAIAISLSNNATAPLSTTSTAP